MIKMKEHNYFVDFLRFVFSIGILFYHSWRFTGVFGNGIANSGFLGVDFYFMVTGYLMINSIRNHKKSKDPVLKESFDFIWKKFKNLFPSLLVVFLIGLVFVYSESVIADPEIILKKNLISKVLPELFQLGILGYELPINSSWWYISAMFFAFGILCPLAIKYKEYYCKYIAPLIIFITLGITATFEINIYDPMVKSLFMRNGFYTAIVFISLGNISYVLAEMIRNKKLGKKQIILLSILEIVIYSILILSLHYSFLGGFLFATLLMIVMPITFSNVTYSTKIFKHKIWTELGKYGFYVYLCNISIRTYLLKKYQYVCICYRYLFIKFVIISCLVALAAYILVEIVYKKWLLQKINNKKVLKKV